MSDTSTSASSEDSDSVSPTVLVSADNNMKENEATVNEDTASFSSPIQHHATVVSTQTTSSLVNEIKAKGGASSLKQTSEPHATMPSFIDETKRKEVLLL